MRRRVVEIAVVGTMLAASIGLAGQAVTFGPGAAPPAQAAASGSGAISGTVVDGVTKQPVTGAIVRLTASARGPSVALRALTDARGRFVFRSLPPLATYAINTTKAGYTDSAGTRFPVGNEASIALADGEWLSNLDIVLYRLSTISGRVVDERGEPVVGVPVRALLLTAVAGLWQTAAGPVTNTDDRGQYRIAGLEAGRYIISLPSVQSAVPETTSIAALAGQPESNLPVAAGDRSNTRGIDVGTSRLVIGNYATPPPFANGKVQAYPPLFYPDARAVSAATMIDLRPGDSRQGVDFTLTPVPTVRVSGRVTGGVGAKGLVVRLMSEGSEGLGVGSEVATALLHDDGTFVLLNVPAGRYTLQTQRAVGELQARGAGLMAGIPATPGFVNNGGTATVVSAAPDRMTLAIRNTTGDDPFWGRARVDVGSTDVTGVTLELRRTATLTGQLLFEGAPQGLPLIALEPASGDPSLAVSIVPRQGPAATSERFSISGIKTGEYFLRPATAMVKSIIAGGIDYTDRPFDASSGADITNVVVTITDKEASLSGKVRDAQGVAAQGVVVVFPTDNALWTQFGFNPPRIKAASFFGAAGYSLRRLPKGDYFVVALDPSMRNRWQEPGFFAAAAGVATRVTLEWGDVKTQDLTISRVVLR